jgi:hypothetical protein
MKCSICWWDLSDEESRVDEFCSSCTRLIKANRSWNELGEIRTSTIRRVHFVDRSEYQIIENGEVGSDPLNTDQLILDKSKTGYLF